MEDFATFLHPTAIVDAGALIGDGCKIWHWSHICSTAEIGNGVVLGQNTFIGPNVQVGTGSKIQNNVSVFDGVNIGDYVFVGPSVVFTNVLNPRAAVNRKAEFMQTRVGTGVTIGANSTIICGIDLGDYCFIGAGSVVTKNVKPYALMVGNPATQVGWMSEGGERLHLPLTGDAEYLCPNTGDIYRITGDIVRRITL